MNTKTIAAGLMVTAAVACGGEAGAFPRPELMLVEPNESVELSPFDRGRLRMYLETNSMGCVMAARKSPEGDVALTLDLQTGRRPKVTATTKDAGARAVARCLPGILRNVEFPMPAARWRFTATLRFGGPRITVNLSDVGGPTQKLAGGTLFLENTATAALERPAECMRTYFHSEEVLSMVLTATLRTNASQEGVFEEVKQSTAGPEELVRCVATQLASVRLPFPANIHARLRIALLRPTTAPSDAPTDTVVVSPRER